MKVEMLYGFEGLDENGKFTSPAGFIKEFMGEEIPCHFHIDPQFHDMTMEELEAYDGPIGKASGLGPTQYLYFEQGAIIARGRK